MYVNFSALLQDSSLDGGNLYLLELKEKTGIHNLISEITFFKSRKKKQ